MVFDISAGSFRCLFGTQLSEAPVKNDFGFLGVLISRFLLWYPSTFLPLYYLSGELLNKYQDMLYYITNKFYYLFKSIINKQVNE